MRERGPCYFCLEELADLCSVSFYLCGHAAHTACLAHGLSLHIESAGQILNGGSPHAPDRLSRAAAGLNCGVCNEGLVGHATVVCAPSRLLTHDESSRRAPSARRLREQLDKLKLYEREWETFRRSLEQLEEGTYTAHLEPAPPCAIM